jgi:hypothetical protein
LGVRAVVAAVAIASLAIRHRAVVLR